MRPAHTILLVEDNPADVKITQRALKESSLPVDLIVVHDGHEAVEYLQSSQWIIKITRIMAAPRRAYTRPLR